MASHVMDLLEFLLGRTVELSAFVSTLVHKYQVDDMATILQKFKSGAHGIVDVYWNVPDSACENRLEIYGTEGSLVSIGSISQEPGGELTVIKTTQKDYESKQTRALSFKKKIVHPRKISTYKAEVEDFVHAINKNETTSFPPEQSLWNLRLCEAVYRSARTGKVISL